MANLSQYTGGLLKFNKNQSILTVQGTSTQSAAFDSNTVAIYISCRREEEDAYIEIGSNPTATISSSFYIRSYDNSNPGYGGGYVFGPIGVEAGHKVAVVGGGNNLNVHIMEMKY